MGRVYLSGPVWLNQPALGPVGTSEAEADATRSVVGVQGADGGRDLRVRNVSSRDGGVLVDHMPYAKIRRQL